MPPSPAPPYVVPPPFMPEAHLFGYEAWRMAWTLAAEVAWHDESRALRLLGPFGALETEWRRLGQIYSRLLPDGSPASDHEYLGLYGALFGYECIPTQALSE